jgi:hypothetical protein
LLAIHYEALADSAPENAPESSKDNGTYRSCTVIHISYSVELALLLAKIITSDDEKAAKPEPVTAKEHRDVAADLMSEIQVETYSSMDSREKTEL